MIRTVMVVEDDDAIRMVLRTNLEDEGYRVLEATTAEQGLLIVQDEQPDVVLVDLRLPGIHGLDLVRSLRATSQVPIIIVTAQTDSHDVVAGLEAGADDYVTKPFVAKELMARIRTQLRRSAQPEEGGEDLTCGPIELHPDTAEVMRNGEQIPVSRIEFFVLAELIGAKGRVLSRDPCCARCGGTETPAMVASWTTSSIDCATRSKRIRRTPSCCSRCAASGTA